MSGLYTGALFLDVATVSACAWLLVRKGNLTHNHPATIYFVFHFYVVTSRLIGLSAGNPTLFTSWGAFYDPVTPAEISRAVYVADVALISMTAAWLIPEGAVRGPQHKRRSVSLNPHVVIFVATIAFVIGLYGFATNLRLQGTQLLDPVGEPESAYFTVIATWSGLALLALIYKFGFRWYYVVPLGLYLAAVGLQGYHRFRLIIPALFLIQLWMDKSRRRWPTLPASAALVTLALLFFPLKSIGQLYQAGETQAALAASAGGSVADALMGRSDEHGLLDSLATTLTLVDEHDGYFLGEPYIALLVLPIPRASWPEKPSITAHIEEISRPSRPMKTVGMVTTLPGEAYANFGPFGVVIVPFLVALTLKRAHRAATAHGYPSTQHFAHLLVASSLLQVYRDGLTSIIMFTFVHMAPLVFLVVVQSGLTAISRYQRSAGALAR